MTHAGDDPLAWTRAYGYLYPREVFRAALVAASRPLTETEIDLAWSEWETRNAAWRSSVVQRFNQARDANGRFAAA